MVSYSNGNGLNLVSMGDSQTALRANGAALLSQTYPGLIARARGYGSVTNVGISGNTTTQMLARFSDDVLVHRSGAVSVMGGPNDMTSNISGGVWVGGGISVATTKSNLKTMVQNAQAQRSRVTLCSFFPILIPVYQANASQYLTAFSEIVAETGCQYLDVYSAVMALPTVDREALYIASEAPDYQHPNVQGHVYVAGLAAAAAATTFQQF